MVLLTITPDILSSLSSLSTSVRNKLSLPAAPTLGAPISHSQIIILSRHLTKTDKESRRKGDQDTSHGKKDELTTGSNGATDSEKYSLDFLLRGTSIYVAPPPPKPEPSAEYLALKARLQAASEANAYNALLQPRPISGAPHRPSLLSISSQPGIRAPKLNSDDDYQDEDHLTPSLVLNILLSILLTGFSTYWAISHFRLPAFLLFIVSSPSSASASSSRLIHESYPGSRSTGPARVFISLAAAAVVGIAEVVIYAAYIRKMRTAREKEMNIVERKVGFMVDGAMEAEVKNVDVGEKNQIWGRGVNGGIRRRVREKWLDKEAVGRSD